MKKTVLAIASVLAAAAPFAMAQDNSSADYPYNPYWAERQMERDRWLAERDRRYRNDWRDDYRWRDDRYRDDWRYEPPRRECWNPRARHFEEDRPGEYQNDLDYSRCRPIAPWR